jgi:hypothetical protein
MGKNRSRRIAFAVTDSDNGDPESIIETIRWMTLCLTKKDDIIVFICVSNSSDGGKHKMCENTLINDDLEISQAWKILSKLVGLCRAASIQVVFISGSFKFLFYISFSV